MLYINGQQITPIETHLDTQVDAIKAKTDLIPASPASVSDITTNISVPTADAVSNTYERDVVGNKSDTVAGNSIVALIKQIIAKLVKPTADVADDATVADVIGIKADTVSGTSLVSLSKQVLANMITYKSVPTKNTTDNVDIADVIGNKTDTEDGDSLYSKAYKSERHTHSRNYTYPYKSTAVQITGGAGAWVEGNKTEVIPTATDDIQTFTITHGADAEGAVDIVLDDIRYTFTVPAGTINDVATFLRAQTYTNHCGDTTWAVSGTGADVVFTHSGKHVLGTFLDVGGATGVTATIAHTNVGVGVGKDFDIHYFTPSAPSATTTYQVIFWCGLSGRESRIATKRLIKATAQDTLEPIALQTPILPAGSRISVSLATLAGTSDTLSLALDYHAY